MQIPISATGVRMGRPSLKVKPTVVRLPEGLPERIDALVGPHKRAEFIRDAVEKELSRRERKAST
jgi:metal-responsive CopG/Arc/MetJ family transcriptional regulator